MRTRRLFGFTLGVLLLHALAWRLAVGEPPRPAAVRRVAMVVAVVSVPQGRQVPSAVGGAPSPKAPASLTAPTALTALTAPAPPAPPTPRLPPALARAAPRGARPGRGPDRALALAPAVAGGASPRARPAPRWPVYATRAPPSATLRYALVQQGVGAASAPLVGQATLVWANAGATFTLRLSTATAGRPPREWESAGRFDSAGVAPDRLVERERGRDRRSADFDHDGARVRFSGAPGTPAIAPGAQDRWSWVAQLAAIVEARTAGGPGARPSPGAPAGPWTLQVAGLRGDVQPWTFRALPPGDPPPQPPGTDPPPVELRAQGLLHVLRAPERPYDLRVEAWLSPALHHFPAALRLSTPPGPWAVTLALAGGPPPDP